MTNNRFIPPARHNSFIYFRGCPGVPKVSFSRRRVRQLNWWLNRISRRKSNISRVNVIMEYNASEYRFTIQKHPNIPTQSSKNDMVVMRPRIPELRTINHRNQWRTEAYRMLFGKVFYGDKNYFSDLDIFTLEPLLEYGKNALQCRNIPGLEEVILIQCKFRTASGEILAMHGPDAIDMINEMKQGLLSCCEIISAKFRFRINTRSKAQILKIRLGNQAEYPSCCEKIIEAWLTERGFKHGNK